MNKIYKYNLSGTTTTIGVGSTGLVSGSGSGSGSGSLTLDNHYFWGQPYNGTQNVNGTITVDTGDINIKLGDLYVQGDDDSEGNFIGGSIYAVDTSLSGNLYTAGDTSIGGNTSLLGNLTVDGNTNISGTTYLTDLQVSNTGYISNLTANSGNITDLSGESISYDSATFKKAIIDTLNSTEITTDYLTVTKQAHFFELVIDKIKAAGGAVILSPADGFKIDKIDSSKDDKHIYLYWRANDGEKAISNMWEAGDQAICQSFNQAQLGTNYNVSSKYYWCVVDLVGTETIDDVDYHYIALLNEDGSYVGTLNPEIGDEIAMLGSRDSDSRQSAIYISAYNSLDQSLQAPFICHYKGINDFNLSAHKYTWFAANGNTIRGSMLMENGDNIEDYISNNIVGSYIHFAYSNSEDGSADFSKESGDYMYLGICYNNDEDDSDLEYTDYKWTKIKGEQGDTGKNGSTGPQGDKGDDADFYSLRPIVTTAQVTYSGNLAINLSYNIIHHVGDTQTIETPDFNAYHAVYRLSSENTNHDMTIAGNLNYYINNKHMTDYNNTSNPPTYITVTLLYGNEDSSIIAKECIPITFKTSAVFELDSSIRSYVAGNYVSTSSDDWNNLVTGYSEIKQDVSTIQSQIVGISTNVDNNTSNIESINTSLSSIIQRCDSIELNVSTNTKNISDNSNNIAANTTNIANLQITADGLTSKVEKIYSTNLFGDGSDLFGDLQNNNTEEDYENNCSLSYTSDDDTWTIDNPQGVESDDTEFYVTKVLSNIDAGSYILSFTPNCDINARMAVSLSISLISTGGDVVINPSLGTGDDLVNPSLGDFGISTVSDDSDVEDETVTINQGSSITASATVNDSRLKLIVTGLANNTVTSKLITYSDDPTNYNGSLVTKEIVIPDNYIATITLRWSTKWNANDQDQSADEYVCSLSETTLGIYNATNTLIKQTSDMIKLQVDQVALTLTDQKVTIDGNTEINGTLIMNDSDQGFILNGDTGYTQISPKSVGTYDSFLSTTSNSILKTASAPIAVGITIDENPIQNWYKTFDIKLGTLISGKNVQFNSGYSSVDVPLDCLISSATITSVVYMLKNANGTVLKSTTSNSDTINSTFISYTPSANIEDATMQVTINGTYTLKTATNNSNATIIQSTIFTVNTRFLESIGTTAYTLIGYDGIGMNFGNNKSFFVSQEGCFIKYDSYGLKITNTGFQKYIGSTTSTTMTGGESSDTAASNFASEYTSINGVAVRKLTGNGKFYLQPNDELIINMNSNANTLYLPTPSSSNAGRRIYVKNGNSSGSLAISVTSGYIHSVTGSGNSTNLSITGPYMFISDGSYWQAFKLYS